MQKQEKQKQINPILILPQYKILIGFWSPLFFNKNIVLKWIFRKEERENKGRKKNNRGRRKQRRRSKV